MTGRVRLPGGAVDGGPVGDRVGGARPSGGQLPQCARLRHRHPDPPRRSQIPHTDDAKVLDNVNRFARFRPFVNRVKSVVGIKSTFCARRHQICQPAAGPSRVTVASGVVACHQVLRKSTPGCTSRTQCRLADRSAVRAAAGETAQSSRRVSRQAGPRQVVLSPGKPFCRAVGRAAAAVLAVRVEIARRGDDSVERRVDRACRVQDVVVTSARIAFLCRCLVCAGRCRRSDSRRLIRNWLSEFSRL